MDYARPREFEFTEQDFQRIRQLIHQRAGIALGDSKQELVYSRLARRLRATGHKRFSDYLDVLQSGSAAEWEEFINALTTNLTSFFREPHHFPILAEHLRQQEPGRALTLWCSACSTGEEAYSMAMAAVEAFGGYGRAVHIIASDLDTKVLQVARAGRYPAEALSRLPAQQVERFFQPCAGQPGQLQARPELQKMIDFRCINLLDAVWPIHPPLDAIFCRNVMIYFDKNTQLAILKKFAPLLRENGLLFAGHSESFHHASAWFRLRGHTVYELAALPR